MIEKEQKKFISDFEDYLANKDAINESIDLVSSYLDKIEILANDCEYTYVYSEYLFLCGYISWSYITSSPVGSNVEKICERGKAFIDEAYRKFEDKEYLIFKTALSMYHMFFVHNYSDASNMLKIEKDYPEDIESIEESLLSNDYLSLIADITFERIFKEYTECKTSKDKDFEKFMLIRHAESSIKSMLSMGVSRTAQETFEEKKKTWAELLEIGGDMLFGDSSLRDEDGNISLRNCVEELLRIIALFEDRIDEISKNRLLLEIFIEDELGENCKVRSWKKFAEAYIRWRVFCYGEFVDDSDYDLTLAAIQETVKCKDDDDKDETVSKTIFDFQEDKKHSGLKEFLILKGLVLFLPFHGGLDSTFGQEHIEYIRQARELLRNIDDISSTYNEDSLNFFSKATYLRYYNEIEECISKTNFKK